MDGRVSAANLLLDFSFPFGSTEQNQTKLLIVRGLDGQ
jgi:hypothetical protein